MPWAVNLFPFLFAEESVPPDILSACDHSLPNFSFSLNFYQQQAVQKALTKSFTLIQGPPGN